MEKKDRNGRRYDFQADYSKADLQENDDDIVRGKMLGLKIATILLTILSLSLLTALIYICVVNDNSSSRLRQNSCIDNFERNDTGRNKRNHVGCTVTRTNGSDVFDELSIEEIKSVVDFLHSNTTLNLVHPKMVPIATNFIHTIEMQLPDKDKVDVYLQGMSDKPERKAKVIIFFGARLPPVVEEYIVGGLGSAMYAHRLETTSRRTSIPFTLRPFSTAEFISIFRKILPKITMMTGRILKESYDALPMKCGDKCLSIAMSPISSAYLGTETARKSWFWFNYKYEFTSVRPLDFQFLVDMTSVNPEEWVFENVWYANQMFPNIEDFVEKYDKNIINKTKMSFPSGRYAQYGTMEFRKPLVPEKAQRAPRQFEPDGRRFQIADNEIHYMNWKLNFRVSTTGGLHLMNIRFLNERIVYELSMQDVVVTYGGHSPVSRIMNYADGAGIFGTRYRGLMPGVDCPAFAQFVNTTLYSSNEFGARIFENALCVFEFNSHSPLRRHRAYGRSGALYGGLESISLVIRSIISVVNYDYVFDYIFYASGAIETKVSMTGFLGTSMYFPEELQYGTRIHDHLVAPLHHHLFNFKVDLDIKGRKNRYETLDIKIRNETNPWFGYTELQQFIERSLKTTELNATHTYNFNTPKVHLISSHDHVSDLQNPRAYRILINKMSKQLFPEGYGFENGVPWSRYQMAVTKYKVDEDRSSSIFTMWDAKNPVVDFQKYINDNDSIVDEDLVAWITLGTQHLPQTENLPNNAVPGAELSFLLLPFNYFDEDPSMTSRDAVRITPLDENKPLEGAKVEHYGALEKTQCTPEYDFPTDLLQTNSTFLFS